MKDFEEIILRKFPHNEKIKCYKKPFLASYTGRALTSYPKITSPSDVVAIHIIGGLFSSSSIVITKTHCFYSKAIIELEDIKTASYQGKILILGVNQAGALIQHNLTTDSEEAAKFLADFFDSIILEARKTPTDLVTNTDYSQYGSDSSATVNWLLIRDEVMRTIDMLYKRYEDGKLTLLEYEDKKTELLSRL
jgi:hypothetical protein